MKVAAFSVVAAASAEAFYEFSNAHISQCAIDGRRSGVPWLTRNNATYICKAADWDALYDPASSIAYTAMNPGDGPPTLACPNPSQKVRCFVFASWGQVAGGPDACTDECSTKEKTGAESCCGKACTAPGGFSLSDDDAKCADNAWHPDQSGDCGAGGRGYCDCCPDCEQCVHPKNESSSASLVANRFCDCRRGTEVSPDYSPCWNSCLDCLGDDGVVAYMPLDVAADCVGSSACYPWAKPDSPTKGYNGWFSCTSPDPAACRPSHQQRKSADIPPQSKMKMAALCGP